MKLRTHLTLTLLTASFAAQTPVFAAAKTNDTFTATQKTAIEHIVQNYLLTHPDILIQMTQTLQQQEVKKRQEAATSAIPANADKLFNAKFSPVLGNKFGTVTVVEFFDYQCGHCRHMDPTMKALPAKHPNLRIIYKLFPIFGADSEFASRVALAAQKQNKFNEMHHALMTTEPPLTKKKVLDAAKAAGLNTAKLEKDAKDPAVDTEIAATIALAKALGIMGTPSLIISNPTLPTTTESQKNKEATFLPGAVDADTLDAAISKFK